MRSKLDQLRKMTTVVADTGDIEAVRRLKPVDCTTNPSIVLKALGTPEFEDTMDEAVAWGARQGGDSGGPRRRGRRPAGGLGRRRARRHRPRARLDRSRRRPLLRHRRLDRPRRGDHRRLRRAPDQPRAHPGEARLHLGGHSGGRGAAEERHRLQPDAALQQGPGHRLRRRRRVPDLAVRRPDLRLVRQDHREDLRARGGPRRAFGPRHLQLLQGARHPDRRHGRVVPLDRTDRGARRLRPADDRPEPARGARGERGPARAQALARPLRAGGRPSRWTRSASAGR